ncbi:hypothetical protein D3C76_1533900 [compost metagenome]
MFGGLIMHHGREQIAPFKVGQRLGLAATHRSHQRVGGPQINTGSQAALMRRSREARLANL